VCVCVLFGGQLRAREVECGQANQAMLFWDSRKWVSFSCAGSKAATWCELNQSASIVVLFAFSFVFKKLYIIFWHNEMFHVTRFFELYWFFQIRNLQNQRIRFYREKLQLIYKVFISTDRRRIVDTLLPSRKNSLLMHVVYGSGQSIQAKLSQHRNFIALSLSMRRVVTFES